MIFYSKNPKCFKKELLIIAIIVSGCISIVYATGTIISNNYIITPTLNATTINTNNILINGTKVIPNVNTLKITNITITPGESTRVIFGPVAANFVFVIMSGSLVTSSPTVVLLAEIGNGGFASQDQINFLRGGTLTLGLVNHGGASFTSGPYTLPMTWEVELLGTETSAQPDYITVIQF